MNANEQRRLQFLLEILNDYPRTPVGEKLARVIEAINGHPTGNPRMPNRELDSLRGRLRFIPSPKSERGLVWSIYDDNRFSLALTEGVEAIEQLLAVRLVHRLRECRCGTWFFGRRDNHRHCSGACREKEFRSTAHGKQMRRKYMQKYRRQPSNRTGKHKRGGK
jgi:hypothetical protein